jgi:hypothetical protein
MMSKTLPTFALLAVVAGSTGCSFMARDAESYQKDTEALLETRSGAIKACYDETLKTDGTAQGRVTVRFKVEKETGNITDIQVDPAGTTAPETLSQCVTTALGGLVLQPPDASDGAATFSYEFVINPPKAAATG